MSPLKSPLLSFTSNLFCFQTIASKIYATIDYFAFSGISYAWNFIYIKVCILLLPSDFISLSVVIPEFPGVGDGKLVVLSPWGCRELDMTK